MLEKINQYWQQLSQQQRRYGLILMPLLLLFFFYYVLIYPFQLRQHELKIEINQKLELLNWMQQVTPTYLFIQAHKIVPAQTLSSAINLSLASVAGLSPNITRLTEKKMQLSFAKVDFDKWLSWVMILNYSFPMTIEDCDIKRLASNNEVTIKMTINS